MSKWDFILATPCAIGRLRARNGGSGAWRASQRQSERRHDAIWSLATVDSRRQRALMVYRLGLTAIGWLRTMLAGKRNPSSVISCSYH